MPAGLGGGGAVAISLETVMGTYQDPSTAGTVWVPVLNEGLVYTEDKYYSPQIRQQSIVSDVQKSYYHAEGPISMEVDPNFLPYFLYCSRHLITKTGSGPYVYKFSPSSVASAGTAASGAVARTASITVIRNGVGFGYAGCVLNTLEFTIDNGVLIANFGVLGLGEETPVDLDTAAWIDPDLFGADTHSVYVAASGASPTFGAASLDFNGFTANINYNATPENRIRSDRRASYIAFHITEGTWSSELDFIDKTEYENFVNATTRAVRLASLHGGSTLAAATDGFQIDMNRTAYDAYTVGLGGMGDLIMANTTGRALAVAGGDAIAISVKSAANIT